MPSRDPWASLPNLGDTPKTHSELNASELETIRSAGDPSRFFPSSRAGEVDAVTGRINNQPRCKVWTDTGETGHGPGFGFAPSTFGGWRYAEYNTDGMFQLGSPFIVCRTPGLYLVNSQFNFGPNPNAAVNLWMRMTDPTTTFTVSDITLQGWNPTAFSVHLNYTGLWNAQRGDQLANYFYSSVATDFHGGQYECFMSACMISTFGSD